MLVGLVSDIHANAVALEAVAEDMPDVDAMLNAGDVVGYNPWPRECVEWVRERSIPTVQGNHDRAVGSEAAFGFNAMAAAGVDYAVEVLTEEQREWLATLPTERTAFDGRVKVVHGHPDDPDRYTYPQQFGPELLGEEDVLVMGHTHVQAVREYDEGVVVNPGSVGQPRDQDPRAAYALLDLDGRSVQKRRVEYDIERVQEAVETAGLPRQIGSRLEKGR